MDLTNPIHLFGTAVAIIIVLVLAIKYLIDHSFKQQEKLKALEGVILTNMLNKFEQDIDGLGSKLRGFKSAMESFQSSVAQIGVTHESINLRIRQVETVISSLDKKIIDTVHYELLKQKT